MIKPLPESEPKLSVSVLEQSVETHQDQAAYGVLEKIVPRNYMFNSYNFEA